MCYGPGPHSRGEPTPHPTHATSGGRGANRRLAALLAAAAIAFAQRAAATPEVLSDARDDLDPRVRWRVAAVRLEGVGRASSRAVRALLATRPRPRLQPWRERPPFEAEILADDLARVAAFYRARGHYLARVAARFEIDPGRERVVVVIEVDEGMAVRVSSVDVDTDAPVAPDTGEAPTVIPLAPGDPFDEGRYDEGRARLLAQARLRGFARATVGKRAVVDPDALTARIFYRVRVGPPCRFGTVRVEGLERVRPSVVLRESPIVAGEPFDPRHLEATRRNLLQLRLFRSVAVIEDATQDPVVPITIRAVEAPHREVRLGLGYDTEEQVRGLAAWRSYDFLGDARQLGFTARASLLRRTLAADFLQPRWPLARTRARVLLAFEQDEEDTYTLTQGRLSPRVEWTPASGWLLYGAYRAERNRLSSVDGAVSRALAPDATPRTATLSALGFGADWIRVDDPLYPRRGWIANGQVEPVGSWLGGDTSFVRLVGTLRLYHPLPLGLIGAARLKLGTADPVAGSGEIPLWERFYAGGIDSVRGYARRRVGPLARDEPLGGRSLTEGSIELRRLLTHHLALAAFVDGGQASRKSFDAPVHRLQYGTGAGLHYTTPIGPIRLDIGVPLDRRGDDDAWQLHVSVGQAF